MCARRARGGERRCNWMCERMCVTGDLVEGVYQWMCETML